MAEIPQELVTEILLCSPVKSLLRFRCVSKSLCAIINHVDFVNWHLSRCSENMIHRKLIFQDGNSRFHVCNMNDNMEEVGHLKPLPYSRDQVYGYCNGLLLLYRGCLRFALWNLSTRQYKNIPDCPLGVGIHRIIMSGLGYDSIDGYKAVVMLYQESRFEVWSFGVRANTWTMIQRFPYAAEYFQFHTEPSIGMFADGGLYWLLLKSPQKILAFDLRNETFSLAPLPVCPDGVLTDLHVLEDCLCVSFFYNSKPPTHQADLYMRNKDGVNWTKVYSVKKPEILNTFRFTSVKVLGYLKSRDCILLDFSMEDVLSYDLKKKSFGKVAMKMSPLWDHPILCLESLVSIQR